MPACTACTHCDRYAKAPLKSQIVGGMPPLLTGCEVTGGKPTLCDALAPVLVAGIGLVTKPAEAFWPQVYCHFAVRLEISMSSIPFC